ncbi:MULTISPECIES: methyl-accepting chemotaxis protein [Paraburkholderia]|uniref:methyl-accepting chemotaxis protein n=1 Tax=Paraburkholderia sp. WS6 TaxID=2938787 RepID=UPI002659B5EC|nr:MULTISPECIES: methyl-accepting chemotaxis protein [Paraburkholderia]
MSLSDPMKPTATHPKKSPVLTTGDGQIMRGIFRRFRNLRIGVRLAIAFSLAAFLTVVLGATAFVKLTRITNEWTDFESVTLTRLQILQHAKGTFGDAVHNYKDYVLRGGDYKAKFLANLDDIDAAVKALETGGHLGADEQRASAVLFDATTGYRASMDRLSPLVASGAAIDVRDRSVAGADKPIGMALDALIQIVIQRTKEQGATITELAQVAEVAVVVVTIAALIAATLLAFFMTRSITRPIGAAVTVARAVANGDLTSEITVDRTDETGQLLDALRSMNERVSDVVRHVHQTAESVATASAQISAGNDDLSRRTEQQAASLEETAASMEQLTATVKHTAENAMQASTLANAASEATIGSSAEVGRVAGTMNQLAMGAQQMGSIIGVIEGIAFQTNILALNAAVEAARAGELGRGFAVVASEVRMLAQRSAAAAKEIKDLILTSNERVTSGASLAQGAGDSMRQVSTTVARVTALERVRHFEVPALRERA